jgi:predicted DNA-binding WGR domain protein
MTAYPIHVSIIKLLHKGGTKEYTAYEISSKYTGVAVFRFGKVGAFGQLKVETYTKPAGSEAAVIKKLKEKASGGYVESDIKEFSANNEAELRSIIGRVMITKIGKAALLHVDPDFNVAGIPELREAEYDEDGHKVDVAKRFDPIALEQARVRDLALREEEDRKRNSSIPNFGLF